MSCSSAYILLFKIEHNFSAIDEVLFFVTERERVAKAHFTGQRLPRENWMASGPKWILVTSVPI